MLEERPPSVFFSVFCGGGGGLVGVVEVFFGVVGVSIGVVGVFVNLVGVFNDVVGS